MEYLLLSPKWITVESFILNSEVVCSDILGEKNRFDRERLQFLVLHVDFNPAKSWLLIIVVVFELFSLSSKDHHLSFIHPIVFEAMWPKSVPECVVFHSDVVASSPLRQSDWLERRAARGQLLKCRRLYLDSVVSVVSSTSPLFLKRQMKNSASDFFTLCLSPTSSFFFKGLMTHVVTFSSPLVHTVTPGEAVGVLKASGAPETFLSPNQAGF